MYTCGTLVALVQVTLAGSGFDTLLGVYTGTAVNTLLQVASNDNCTTDVVTSCATFSVMQSVRYMVQVAGAKGAKGAVSVDVRFAGSGPRNDAFWAAVTVFPVIDGTTVGATLETGEPVMSPGASGSVWYRFTAVTSGIARVRFVVPVEGPDSLYPLS
jgi:hypothetical protein